MSPETAGETAHTVPERQGDKSDVPRRAQQRKQQAYGHEANSDEAEAPVFPTRPDTLDGDVEEPAGVGVRHRTDFDEVLPRLRSEGGQIREVPA